MTTSPIFNLDAHPLLLFDLDGTLIDSRADLATATNLMRAHYGLPPLSLSIISTYVGDGLRVLAIRALEGFAADPSEATYLLSEAYTDHLTEQTTPYPDVDTTLRALHRAHIPLVLITNKPSAHARRLFDHFGWTPLFALLLGGGDTPELKPSPVPLQTAMQKLGYPPEHTWMIGDHHTDLEAARRAGTRSIFLTSGIGKVGHESPALVLPHFSALLDVFGVQL